MTVEIINDWCRRNVSFGLQLPNGWFGRPYDNMHHLTGIFDRPNKLIIEIDPQLYLVFTKPTTISVDSDENLVCSNFSQLVFDRQGYGDMKPFAEIFRSGSVTLMTFKTVRPIP